eukprot:scaffold81127_cov67-Cyclotella_meneghiniana.AAC.2
MDIPQPSISMEEPEEEDPTKLLPHQLAQGSDSPENVELEHQQQGSMMQQQQGYMFGMDPNWGFGMMHDQSGYHGMQPGGLDGIPGLSMDPLESLLGPFPCARVRGLPFEATLEDVLVFFQGLVVIDVVLVSHAEAGEAFVVFANPMDFQMGLQRDRQNMGNRYLEVFQGKRADYYAAIASQNHHWQGSDLRNVSSEQGEHVAASSGEDGSDALTGTSLKSNSAGGSAWGQSSPVRSSPNHHHHHHHQHQGRGSYGRGYNNGYRGRGEYGRGRGYRGNNYNSGRGSTGGGIRDGVHTGYIRMRGLPFQATKQDILEFFSEHNPVEDSIIFTYRGDGRATGEGYIAFKDASDAKDAMALHRSTIGSRYIELFISNKEEHTRNIARSNPP